MIDYTFSLEELEYFLLILVRVTCFIYVAPFFGMNNVPRRVKIGLGFFISMVLYHIPSVPHVRLSYQTVWGYGVIVMKEALTGLLIGFGAQLCTSIVNFAGRLMDMNIGLSMVNMMDPTTRENTSISGVFLQYITMLILLITGMDQFLLKALADSYHLIPISGAVFKSDSLTQSLVRFMGEYITIGFRIALPVFAAIFILNAVLGILAKTAPQMNMFSVGIQLKLLVGLMVMFFTVSMLPGATEFVFKEMRSIVTAMMEGMV